MADAQVRPPKPPSNDLHDDGSGGRSHHTVVVTLSSGRAARIMVPGASDVIDVLGLVDNQGWITVFDVTGELKHSPQRVFLASRHIVSVTEE